MDSSELRVNDKAQVVWVKSSYSMSSGDCVEVAQVPEGAVAVRDSKDVSREPLRFTAGKWSSFQRGVMDGGLSS